MLHWDDKAGRPAPYPVQERSGWSLPTARECLLNSGCRSKETTWLESGPCSLSHGLRVRPHGRLPRPPMSHSQPPPPHPHPGLGRFLSHTSLCQPEGPHRCSEANTTRSPMSMWGAANDVALKQQRCTSTTSFVGLRCEQTQVLCLEGGDYWREFKSGPTSGSRWRVPEAVMWRTGWREIRRT